MFLAVNKSSRDRNSAKQLKINKRVAKNKNQNKSAANWVASVAGLFLLCYGIYVRCSLIILTGHPCNNFHYKVPLPVINSGTNPLFPLDETSWQHFCSGEEGCGGLLGISQDSSSLHKWINSNFEMYQNKHHQTPYKFLFWSKTQN